MSKQESTLHDAIVHYIRTSSEAVSSQLLAERFLKFKNPDHRMARIAMKGVLGTNTQCICDKEGLWHFKQTNDVSDPETLLSLPWACVFLLYAGSRPDLLIHLSVWSPGESPSCLFSGWCIDPQTLSYEEQQILIGVKDTDFSGRAETIMRCIEILENKTMVFISSRQHRNFENCCNALGESISDDVILLSQLMHCAQIPTPKPLNLPACFSAVTNMQPQLTAAYHYGESFALLVRLVQILLLARGINTREELDFSEQQTTLRAEWADALFSFDEILMSPQNAGVYGFKNRDQEYIYIGKAKNLRRRLMSYFRVSDESPEKMNLLRKYAHELTVYPCGSELESLLLEQRLIQKHKPVFNSKVTINERKGLFTPLQDCIVLLPHIDPDKGMSIWVRKNQKMIMKAFLTNFEDSAEMTKQIESFFFQGKLPPQTTDFPEQEIVSRWVKRHINTLTIVPVYRMATSSEVVIAMQCSWNCLKTNAM